MTQNNRTQILRTPLDTVSRPNTAYSRKDPLNFAKIQKFFSIAIFELVNDGVVEPVAANGLDPAGRKTLSYFFTVPPKDFSIDEPYTTNIVATQNAGKYVESHGSIIKSVKLQGTTGLRPNKSGPFGIPNDSFVNDISLLDDTLEQLDTITSPFSGAPSIPDGERTGHDDIIFLRNIFRFYSDNAIAGNTRRLVMLFRNVKDDDYWVVEPLDFRLVRSSRSPVTYDYVIQLKTLSPFVPFTKISDSLNFVGQIRRYSGRLQEAARALTNVGLVVVSNSRKLAGMGWSGARVVMSPFIAMANIANEAQSASEDNKRSFQQLSEFVKNSFNDGIDVLTGQLPLQDPILNTLRRGVVAIERMQTSPVFQPSVSSRVDSTQRRNTSAYKGDTPTTRIHSSVSEGIVNGGDTIRSLSRRLTGSENTWRDIVQLNSLISPYISEDPSAPEGVLNPGDTVLYPSRDFRGTETGSISLSGGGDVEKENFAAGKDSRLIESFGRDIRLRSSSSTESFQLTDLALNQRGDISTLYGVANMEQAVKIKFLTEQGELPAHPYFGTRYPIGTKAVPELFDDFRINTLATLSSDGRIKSVDKIRFASQGDGLVMNLLLQLTDSRDFLNLDFSINRF